MGATIVVGGQFGSEGKGKVVALESGLCDDPWVVRCGGPNSGHTTCVNGVERVLRQLPAAAGHPRATLLLSAGCAIDIDILLSEIETCKVPRDRIVIDPRAILITEADRLQEDALRKRLGSTASGTGAALVRRMLRGEGVTLAANCERLRTQARVESVAPLLHAKIQQGAPVIVEGTQGFGLSLLHGPRYPFVTARDTTASGFAAEVGLSPRDVTAVILVVRTFPIRVGGNSGPLPNETDWEDVCRSSGANEVHPEFTSVTKTLRRVARFDMNMVREAARYNGATALAVMGLDRLDASLSRIRDGNDLGERVSRFLFNLAQVLKTPIIWGGTGFNTYDAIRDPLRSSTNAHVVQTLTSAHESLLRP